VRRLDTRIDRQGAMSAAMVNMAINTTAPSERGRFAVGVGFQGGKQAVSMGFGRRIGKSATLSIGAAFSGSEKSGGVGLGWDL
jgi:hypothetical protein